MNKSFCVSLALLSAIACAVCGPALGAPSTSTFMNVMTVCGAGSSVRIDADLQGSIVSVYEKEATRGRLSQQILPEIAKLLPQGKSYEIYLECVGRLLGRD